MIWWARCHESVLVRFSGFDCVELLPSMRAWLPFGPWSWRWDEIGTGLECERESKVWFLMVCCDADHALWGTIVLLHYSASFICHWYKVADSPAQLNHDYRHRSVEHDDSDLLTWLVATRDRG